MDFLKCYFFDNKEKRRRHTGVWQVFLTQLAEKYAKKTYGAKILNRLLCTKINVRDHQEKRKPNAFKQIFTEN